MTTRRTILTGLAVAAVPLPAIAASEGKKNGCPVQAAMDVLVNELKKMHGGEWWTIVDHRIGLFTVTRC